MPFSAQRYEMVFLNPLIASSVLINSVYVLKKAPPFPAGLSF
jgi:hypothetical protein